MDDKRRKEATLKLYEWRGIKYGSILGLLLGIGVSFIHPTLVGEIYISIPLVSLTSSASIAITGYLLYPQLLYAIGTNDPLDDELIGFMMEREGGFGVTGFLDSDNGGSSSSADGGGNGGDGGGD